jgi:hypothetical protein
MRKTLIKRVLAGLISAAALAMMPSTALGHPSDNFQGVWRCTLTPDSSAAQNGAKKFDEAVIFDGEEVMAENFAYYGFNPGAFAMGTTEGSTFVTAMDSGMNGKIEFSGTLSGGRLSGTLVWTKKDGRVWRFVMSGSR